MLKIRGSPRGFGGGGGWGVGFVYNTLVQVDVCTRRHFDPFHSCIDRTYT